MTECFRNFISLAARDESWGHLPSIILCNVSTGMIFCYLWWHSHTHTKLLEHSIRVDFSKVQVTHRPCCAQRNQTLSASGFVSPITGQRCTILHKKLYSWARAGQRRHKHLKTLGHYKRKRILFGFHHIKKDNVAPLARTECRSKSGIHKRDRKTQSTPATSHAQVTLQYGKPVRHWVVSSQTDLMMLLQVFKKYAQWIHNREIWGD